MIAGLLRDLDRDLKAYWPFYEAGMTTRVEDLRFCERQQAKLTLAERALVTADAVEFMGDVSDDLDRL